MRLGVRGLGFGGLGLGSRGLWVQRFGFWVASLLAGLLIGLTGIGVTKRVPYEF